MPKKQKVAENLKILQEEFQDSSDEEVEAALGQMVDVNFEGFTAEEDDFHGITRLLSQTFKGLEINLSSIADAIISQNYVGCVIKEVIDDEQEAMEVDTDALEGEPDEEGDFVFGLSTILNLTLRKKDSFHKDITKELEKKCADSSAPDSTKELFSQIINNDKEHLGLLVNERLVNLPCQVALPAFSTLRSEVDEANKIKLPFSFKYIIMLCKIYKIKTLKMKKKGKNPKAEAETADEKTDCKEKEVWGNVEEEIFAEFSSGDFEYSVQNCHQLSTNSWNDGEAPQKNVTEFRRVLILPVEKLEEAVAKAVQTLGQA